VMSELERRDGVKVKTTTSIREHRRDKDGPDQLAA